jgi:hypothetical protein
MVGVADVSCAGTVSNLAQGMSKMQLELERVRGAEDLIRENERLRLQNRLLELRVKSLEDEYNVPVDKRFDVVQAPHPVFIIMRHTRLLIVSIAYPATVTLLCVCHRLACLLHKCVREEKCVRLCACLLKSLSYLTDSDGCFLADKRLREVEDPSTPSQTLTVEKRRDAGPMLGLMCMPMSASTPSAAYTPSGKSMKTVWLWLMSTKNKGVIPSNVSKQHRNLINLIDS